MQGIHVPVLQPWQYIDYSRMVNLQNCVFPLTEMRVVSKFNNSVKPCHIFLITRSYVKLWSY